MSSYLLAVGTRNTSRAESDPISPWEMLAIHQSVTEREATTQLQALAGCSVSKPRATR